MINIDKYIHDLKWQDGIWRSEEDDAVSYPENGHNSFNEIEENSFWFTRRNDIILEAVKRYFGNGLFFDVGGGNGFVSTNLKKVGYDTVLVEPSFAGCLNAKKRSLNHIVNSAFNTKYFYPDSAENIGVFDVLEHIKNPQYFLKTVHTILAKKGILFITVPAKKILWSKEDEWAGHYQRYEKNEICRLIDENDYEILYVTYFYRVLVLPIFLMRTIPSFLGIYRENAKKTANQHEIKTGTKTIFDTIMNDEIEKIRKGDSIRFGSSLLAVARKK